MRLEEIRTRARIAKSKHSIVRKDDDLWQLIDSDIEYLLSEVDCLTIESEALKAELQWYRELEQAGRLIELPCKADDKLWYSKQGRLQYCRVMEIKIDGKVYIEVIIDAEDENDGCCDMECKGCPFQSFYTNYEAGDGGCNSESGFYTFEANEIGKKVFLTREEAQSALDERMEDK